MVTSIIVQNEVQSSVPVVTCIGLRVRYLRWGGECYHVYTGVISAEQAYTPIRWRGQVVFEYEITPDRGQTNLSSHTVWEGDVLDWHLEDDSCPRCMGYGYTGVRNGDDDLTCTECQGTGVKS